MLLKSLDGESTRRPTKVLVCHSRQEPFSRLRFQPTRSPVWEEGYEQPLGDKGPVPLGDSSGNSLCVGQTHGLLVSHSTPNCGDRSVVAITRWRRAHNESVWPEYFLCRFLIGQLTP